MKSFPTEDYPTQVPRNLSLTSIFMYYNCAFTEFGFSFLHMNLNVNYLADILQKCIEKICFVT